jgi:cytosine/adenosine deaminase-related metal-dependent hydrolase
MMNIEYRLIPAALTALLTACQPQTSGTAITNVTLIDAVNGVRENQTVVVEDDAIVAVVPSDQDTNATTVIDGAGKYLIPGLWDFHVHFTFDERLTDAMPALFLSYGVTSVRDTGGLIEKIQPVVDRMSAANAVAPRVFYAGPLLDGADVVYDGSSAPALGIPVATPDEARTRIRELKDLGIDFIKIYEMVAPDVFAAMIETAQELDLPVDSHVPLALRASEVGQDLDALEHLRNVELDCTANGAELLATRRQRLQNPDDLPGAELRSSLHTLQRIPAIEAYDEAACDRTLDALANTVQVPTLRISALDHAPPYERDDWDDALARVPAAVRLEWQALASERAAAPPIEGTSYGDWAFFLTERMHARGIPIAAGTDTPILLSVPGYSLHAELEYLVRAGMTPLEVLASATVQPAEFFSLEDEMGTIDIGKRADLVLLDADPLENIANTRSIAGVVTKGQYFDIATLRDRIPTN